MLKLLIYSAHGMATRVNFLYPEILLNPVDGGEPFAFQVQRSSLGNGTGTT